MRLASPASLLILPLLWSGGHPADRPAPSRSPERVRANDNRVPSGTLRNGVLTLHLEARLGTWYPDSDSGQGAPVPAFAEVGQATQIPGPMIRVPAGTRLDVSIRNSLPDSTITVHGFHDRPLAGAADSLEIFPGDTRRVSVRLDQPGTYYYWATTMRRPLFFRIREDAQLSGAIIVDGPGESAAKDRVLMIGIWGDTVGGGSRFPGTRALFVVNGRSWPHTERLSYRQGDTINWRVINPSSDIHPMHLHGFYFRINRRGDSRVDTAYAEGRRPLVFTEFMRRGGTMSMTWIPERAGNWLFHCHIPEHFDHKGPLGIILRHDAPPSAHGRHVNHALEQMGGLVMGVHVAPRKSYAPATRAVNGASGTAGVATRRLRLLLRPNPSSGGGAPGFAVTLHETGAEPPLDSSARVGPPIILRRGQPVSITVVNRLAEPTAIHWHGIELDSYFDGVAGFSGAGKRITPAIAPNDSFDARFTPPRSGTFIYHSHVGEIRQLHGGLAGALLVLDVPERYDAATDIPVVITSPKDSAVDAGAVLLNGALTHAPLRLRSGAAHRFRFINITVTRPGTRLELRRDTVMAQWRIVAKDGVDLPDDERAPRLARQPISIGETYDVEITPAAGENLRLELRASNGRLLGVIPLLVGP